MLSSLLARHARNNPTPVCLVLFGGQALCFALSFLAFAMLWVRRIVGTLSVPVQTAWLNRNLDSASRATVISMSGQANSLGQVAGGPALGWVGNAVSIRAALLGSALVLSPTVALYQRMIVRARGVP